MKPTLNADEWMRVLEKLAAALPPQGPPVKLCLIGSAACLFGGMDGRTSADLNVWRPHSDYDRVDDFELNEILWRSIKGRDAPLPPAVRRAIANRPAAAPARQ